MIDSSDKASENAKKNEDELTDKSEQNNSQPLKRKLKQVILMETRLSNKIPEFNYTLMDNDSRIFEFKQQILWEIRKQATPSP